MASLVSIIVPIYNQERFLSQCLDSIAAQSFLDFEVILIDDGSTDSSRDICKDFAAKDPRFIYVSKPNGGVSSARNAGIDKARGEYLLFVDADDILPADALENHLRYFSEGVDLTMGSFIAFSEEDPEVYRVDVKRNETVSTDKCLYDFTPDGEGDWQRYIWNRMFRRDLIIEHNLHFNESIHYKEDGLFLVQYLLCCKGKAAYINDPVYLYRINPTGAMNALDTQFSPKLLTNLDAHILIIKEMKKHHVSEDTIERATAHALRTRSWILGIMKKHNIPCLPFNIKSILRVYFNIGPKMAFAHLTGYFKRVF